MEPSADTKRWYGIVSLILSLAAFTGAGINYGMTVASVAEAKRDIEKFEGRLNTIDERTDDRERALLTQVTAIHADVQTIKSALGE